MLLKRYLALAAGVLLFIIIYLGYFAYEHAQMEGRFRAEREKFGVEGTALTAAAPASGAASTSGAVVPSSVPTSMPVPSPTESPLIGPLPPASSAPTETAPTPASTPPDPASAPAVPPSSTMDEPRGNPFFVLAAYHPGEDLRLAAAETTPAASPSPTAVTTPATNATAGENAEAAPTSVSTNTSPLSATPNGGPPRPVPVEASVIVLGYHQFMAPGESSRNIYKMRADTFEAEMKYLRDNGYHVVPLSDVVRFIKHEIGLPPNSVAITIDDGYKSAIVYAAPILKKYGYPWTYFVYPDFITVNEGVGAASWNDLLALQSEGVDIESHSMTHPFLTHHRQEIKHVWHNLTPEEYDQFLTNETSGSKALLQEKLGKPIRYLAYPYGDYNKEVEAKAIAAGYEAIFTVADNPVHATTNIFSVGRYIITQPVERNFAAYLHQGALGIAEADPAPGATTSNPRPIITAVLGYAGVLDPKSIETDMVDFGAVRHDYDPKTSTVRLYLPRDLVQPVVKVNIRVRDAETGQVMVANWHFNYEPASMMAKAPHAPMVSSPATTNTAVTPANIPSPTAQPSITVVPATNSTPSARASALTPTLSAPSVSPH